ncbi:unnamed protein product [Rotaria sp. Silwood2]|nr:unnamed protein product [Rotaria sp. Silwood2]CAF3396080.1 unnamed protein product [Rotaria sp. Silwood2]CAF4522588.1 unnamed protein product [Rotaria sp. Silwood2]
MKLESSLEALQHYGYPIDRLCTHLQNPTSVPVGAEILSTTVLEPQPTNLDINSQQQSYKTDPPLGRGTSHNKATVSNFSHIAPTSSTTYPSPSDEYDEVITPEIIQESFFKMLSPYNDQKFLTVSPKIEIKRTANGPCQAPANIELENYKDLFYDIPFYTERNMKMTGNILNRARQLALLVAGIATEIFKQPAVMMKIYRDADGNDPRKISYFANITILDINLF